jgi:hypothetical protein
VTEPKENLHITTLPSQDITSITSFLNQEDQNVFRNFLCKDLSHRFIIRSLETSTLLPRALSREIVRHGDLRKKIEVKYGTPTIPITLTFHQDDVALLQRVDVFSFIRRVQTAVFEGPQRFVIEAKHSGADVLNEGTPWHIGKYHPDAWRWLQRIFDVNDFLQSDTVVAVKSIDFSQMATAELVVYLSWSVTEGNMNWTATKTYYVSTVELRTVSAGDILLNPKLSNLQTLALHCDIHRSVIDDVSVLAKLTNLKELILRGTQIVNITSLAQLTTLESLNLVCISSVVDICRT